MNFLRRLFGGSANVQTPSSADDEIIITQYDTGAGAAPAPVIEGPPQPDAKTNANADESRAPSAPAVNTKSGTTPVAFAEELTPILMPNAAVDLAGTRPLPPLETVAPGPGQRIVVGQLSDVGRIRGNNQDAVYSFLSSGSSSENVPDFALFIVADGMGGHHDGEKASAITVRLVAHQILHEAYDFVLQQKMNDPDRPAIADVLREAVQKANEAITEQVPEGGTTATLAVILGDLAYVAHVGDSRAYLVTDEGIEQLTRDHSLVQRLIELDQLTPEEAAEHPQRNVLYRAIGQNDHLDVDVITRRLPPGSHLLLCSDGLWNLVTEEDIHETAIKNVAPQAACAKLVHMANERGGADNITVLLAKIPG